MDIRGAVPDPFHEKHQGQDQDDHDGQEIEDIVEGQHAGLP